MSNTAWLPQGPALLFAPADRPERFAKAADRSDMVILDLEDGCRAENRAEARQNVIHADLDPERTIVRVNPIDSPDFAADLAAVTDSPFRTVMVPRESWLTDSPTTVDRVNMEFTSRSPRKPS